MSRALLALFAAAWPLGPRSWGLVFLAGLAGCAGHLVGTRDVEVDYRLASGAGAAAADLRERVLERIHAVDLAADVEADDQGGLRVTVDESAAPEVDELILWTGGLWLYVVDPAFSMAPKRADGLPLTPHVEEGPNGTELRHWDGPPPAVLRAARLTPPGDGHRLVSDAASVEFPLARTRVVFDPPLADLREGVVWADAAGAELTLTLNAAGRAALERAALLRGGREVAFVRDLSVLVVAPIGPVAPDPETPGGGKITVSLGSSPRAYARAEAAAKLLRTPKLPRLVRASAAHKPPSYALGVAEVVLPIVMCLAWLAFVRRFDRARPEPLWLVLVTFALGGAAVVPASFVEWKLGEASPYTNPQLMTFGGQLSALPLAVVAFSLTVGLVEEGAKLLAAWAVARQRKEFDEPVDGIVYASAAALGFAALESVRYLAAGRVAGTVVVTRAFMSAPAHFLFSSLWGYALGLRLVAPRRRVWPFFLLSVFAHGAFDACLSFPATAHLAPLLNFGLASAFVVMLRRTLRHGPVVPGTVPRWPSAAGLDVFQVGSRGLFAACVVALHASAALVFTLGVYAEQAHHRVGPAFVLVSTLLLAVVGIAAYGVSASLPLDVVLDDRGVTFGGAFLAWADVERVERQRSPSADGRGHHVVLLGRDGPPLSLGPSDAARIDDIASAVSARRSAARASGPSAREETAKTGERSIAT